VDVVRPTAAVFAYVADFTNDPTWRAEVVTSTRTAGDSAEVGARYEQTLRVAGRTIDTSFVVTEYVPDAVIGFEGSSGPIDVQGSLVFVSLGEERTRVLFEHHMAGPIWFRAVEPWLAARRRRGIRRDLDALRRLLEWGS
ncbi:MAG: SRPBCC family protein, partial [Actinomycetota bacterium]